MRKHKLEKQGKVGVNARVEAKVGSDVQEESRVGI
jgi:hypothetical protein